MREEPLEDSDAEDDEEEDGVEELDGTGDDVAVGEELGADEPLLLLPPVELEARMPVGLLLELKDSGEEEDREEGKKAEEKEEEEDEDDEEEEEEEATVALMDEPVAAAMMTPTMTSISTITPPANNIARCSASETDTTGKHSWALSIAVSSTYRPSLCVCVCVYVCRRLSDA